VTFRLALLLLAVGCSSPVAPTDAGPRRDAGFPPVVEPRDGIALVDVTDASGALARVATTRNNVWESIDIYSGSVLFRDLDGDDYPDIVVSRTGTTDPSRHGLRYLVNWRDGTFRDRTREAGLDLPGTTMGLAAADFDGDGRTDLLVGTDGEGDRLYRQLPDGRFEDVAERAGLRGGGRRTRSIGLLDYDLDGWLDVYLTTWDGAGPLGHYGGDTSWRSPDVLLRNRGDGTFEEVTTQAGVGCHGRSALGVATADLDRDDDPDLYVANDFFDDCLYENLGDGTFREVTDEAGVGPHAINAMGVATGDVDGDGWPELVVTDDERPDASTGNAFYWNRGGLRFESAAESLGVDGVASTGQTIAIYWGAGFRDFDGDGDLELHLAQQETGPDLLLEWNGTRFDRVTPDRFEVLNDVRGSAYADYDRDGRVDVVLATRGDSPRLLRNAGGRGNGFVRVRLRGPRGNADGIGATVRVEGCGRRVERAVEGTTGYLSASEPVLTVGVGTCEALSVRARFPGGAEAEGTARAGDDLTLVHP
jgi:hypothetical protein